MFKKLLVLMVLICAFTLNSSLHAEGIYEISVKKTDGKELKLSEFKGKTVMFVNVATRCGYTGQLDDLEKLYQKYKEKDFVIVGIPSNDFGGQTPESNKDVAKFCRLKYGATFPLTEKATVLGPKKTELVKVLIQKGPEIGWNFEKFIVNKEGKVVGRFDSGTTPLSKKLTDKIEATL